MTAMMELHGSTKLSDLLAAYPWLKEELPRINKKFEKLNSPLGRIMVNKATLSEMGRRSGMSKQALTEALTTLIASHSGTAADT